MVRLKKVLRKTGKVLVGLVLVLLVANGLLNYYWGRQIESRLAAIRAMGQPTSFADLQGQPTPEQDNAGPIYRRAFKAMSEPAAKRDMGALHSILHSSSPPPSAKDWASAKSALTRRKGIIALIEQAQSKPSCTFPALPLLEGASAESVQRRDALLNEHYEMQAGLRDAARLLCSKAILCARDGRTQDVVRYTQSALSVAGATRDHAMIVGYLVDVAIIHTVLENMRQALSYCQPSESELRKLDSALSRIDVPELYRHAIEAERVYFLAQNYEFRKAGMTMPPFSSGDTIAYLDFLSGQLECTRMSYSEALSKGLVGPRAADDVPFYADLTKILAPVTARAAGAGYKCEAEIACGRILLALRAYKHRLGQYPRTLRELGAGTGWDLSVDPFTGKDMIYKPVGSGFLLYSVGYDLRDNGGAALQSLGQSKPGGDIGWRLAR